MVQKCLHCGASKKTNRALIHERKGSHCAWLTADRDRFSCRGPGTGPNYEKGVNGTRNSVRKFQQGKRAHLFRFSTFSGWDEPTKRVPFTAEPKISEILTKWKAPSVSIFFSCAHLRNLLYLFVIK